MNHRARRMLKISVAISLCAAAILCARAVISADDPVSFDDHAFYRVTEVLDGDTFRADVEGREITVRMLGIDTPETVHPTKPVQCYGPEASAHAKSLLEGRRVRLAYNPNREKTDKYGRYLFYVYLEDGSFLNEELISDGYAREYTFKTPYIHQGDFRAAQKAAKAAGKGLWSACVKTPPAVAGSTSLGDTNRYLRSP